MCVPQFGSNWMSASACRKLNSMASSSAIPLSINGCLHLLLQKSQAYGDRKRSDYGCIHFSGVHSLTIVHPVHISHHPNTNHTGTMQHHPRLEYRSCNGQHLTQCQHEAWGLRWEVEALVEGCRQHHPEAQDQDHLLPSSAGCQALPLQWLQRRRGVKPHAP
jgi:hypothetical protein